jgi:hypothetical protein
MLRSSFDTSLNLGKRKGSSFAVECRAVIATSVDHADKVQRWGNLYLPSARRTTGGPDQFAMPVRMADRPECSEETTSTKNHVAMSRSGETRV